MAMQGARSCISLGLLFCKQVKYVAGKLIVSLTFDKAYLLLQESLPQASIDHFGVEVSGTQIQDTISLASQRVSTFMLWFERVSKCLERASGAILQWFT